jgi:hypothetical protein
MSGTWDDAYVPIDNGTGGGVDSGSWDTGTSTGSNVDWSGVAANAIGGLGSIAANVVGNRLANQGLSDAQGTIEGYAKAGMDDVKGYGTQSLDDIKRYSRDAQTDIKGYGTQAQDAIKGYGTSSLGQIDAGIGAYNTIADPLLTPNPVMLPQYRGLTDQQRIGREDTIRNGQAQLAASGLRGAGRAGIGAILDQDRRFVADARSQNDAFNRQAMQKAQDVANTARQTKANQNLQGGLAKATANQQTGMALGTSLQNTGNTAGSANLSTGAQLGAANLGIGGQLANIDTQTGQNIARLQAQQGQNSGNAATASGNSALKTAGSIIGAIAPIAAAFL